MVTTREEVDQFMFGSLNNIFKKTGLKPEDIRIVVVNYTLFDPTPSLPAMIVNRYRLRGNIHSINLG